MKKVLSLILAVCMLASFAMVASAAPAGIVLDVVEGETTVTATITVKGDMTNVNVIQAILTYNPAKVTLTGNDIADNLATRFPEGWADNSAQKKATTSLVTYQVKASESKGNTANYLPAGTDFAFATLTFSKNADVEAGDIVIVEKNSFKPNIYTETYVSGSQNKLATAAITNNFTNYEEVVVVDPAVTTESADVAIVVDEVADGTANYTVTVTAAPVFGKAYVVKANGEVINAGVEYAATEATVITVELVDDATKAIHTFAKAYSAAGEAAVFAKFTNGAADYGFKVAAFADDTFSPDMEVFIKDGVFAAANAVDGVFGVKFTGVEAGSYDAVPYADGVEGDAITFVVE